MVHKSNVRKDEEVAANRGGKSDVKGHNFAERPFYRMEQGDKKEFEKF